MAMFEQELEMEKRQSSVVPLLLIVTLILVIVGVAGYYVLEGRQVLSSVWPWVWAKRARNSMTQWSGGDKGTGRVCNGAHERARFSSVAPRHVIRTVVTPAAKKASPRSRLGESLRSRLGPWSSSILRPGAEDAAKETRKEEGYPTRSKPRCCGNRYRRNRDLRCCAG